MSNQVELVFSGEVLPGFEMAQVKTSLAGLLKLDNSKAEALFSGQRVVLKKDLPAAEADRYLQHLAKLGARVQAVPSAPALLSLDDFVVPAPPAAAPVAPAKPELALEPRPEPEPDTAQPTADIKTPLSPLAAVASGKPAVTSLKPAIDEMYPGSIYKATAVAEDIGAQDEYDYEKIGYWQKAVIFLFVASFLAFGAKSSSHLISGLLLIVSGLGQFFAVYKLSAALKHNIAVRILYVFFLLIPILNLFCLASIIIKATKRLREAGFEVGFFGVKDAPKKVYIRR